MATSTRPAATATISPTQIALPIVQRPLVTYTFEVLREYPHDPLAFTQGLVYDQGRFFESTGLNGRSSLREVEIETGRVLRKRDVDSAYFAEGLALVNGELLQLTWREQTGFIYDAATFEQKRTWRYETEGWGLAYDGSRLVMSDGSAQLFFLDPATLTQTRAITVSRADMPIVRLNELEWVDGLIWANVWQTDQIVQIDPESGVVVATIDLTGLLRGVDRGSNVDVLNGIAYDSLQKRIFVTGKLWPKVFEIRLKQP
jgi:glutamine cyclotransferase